MTRRMMAVGRGLGWAIVWAELCASHWKTVTLWIDKKDAEVEG